METFRCFHLLCFPLLLTLYRFLHRQYFLPTVRVRVSYFRNPNFDFVRKNTSLKAFLMQCCNYYALFSLPGLLFPLNSSILRWPSDLSRHVFEKVVYGKRRFAKNCLFGNGHWYFSSKRFLNFEGLILSFLSIKRVLVEFIKYKIYMQR